MLIKKLKLKNIRSYKEEEISLPQGIVLLSGDIGSGKSTILLAIEFALFGLLRGDLTGANLLRHGAIEASVELSFTIDNKEYTIKRTLKKTSKSIEQAAGHIIINGVKKEATPTELKSEILNILGYPIELLTKSKSLIYRYTLYTPQEDMKRILFENEEERLKILRKVFDIDKYERIKQNTLTYNKTIKDKIKHHQGQIFDKQEKQNLKEKIINNIKETEQKINILKPELEELKEEIKEQLENNIKEKIEETKTKIESHEKEISSHREQITTFNTKKQHSEETKTKINSLAECPTCLQQVPLDHKEKIINIQNIQTEEFDKNIILAKEKLSLLEQELRYSKNVLDSLVQKEREIAVQKIKTKQFLELKEKEKELILLIGKIKEEINIISEEIKRKEEETSPLLSITNTYDKVKKDFDAAQKKERNFAVQNASIQQEKESLQKQLEELEKELKLKEEIEKKLEKMQKTLHWTSDFFAPLMDTIEKHVMTRIHQEFNSLFQEWFSTLIEDDLMSAKINENFTPIIEQNNYETEINSLSGGEKTACALAYRLALNKTINKILNTIKTKDLLILDEPTDGFSSEQLDKMRDVLEQLNLKQIIIVSHEQKIEGFADKIIRVNKEEHVSSLIS